MSKNKSIKLEKKVKIELQKVCWPNGPYSDLLRIDLTDPEQRAAIVKAAALVKKYEKALD